MFFCESQSDKWSFYNIVIDWLISIHYRRGAALHFLFFFFSLFRSTGFTTPALLPACRAATPPSRPPPWVLLHPHTAIPLTSRPQTPAFLRGARRFSAVKSSQPHVGKLYRWSIKCCHYFFKLHFCLAFLYCLVGNQNLRDDTLVWSGAILQQLWLNCFVTDLEHIT